MPAPKASQKSPTGRTGRTRNSLGPGLIVQVRVATPCMSRMASQAMHEDDAASLGFNAHKGGGFPHLKRYGPSLAPLAPKRVSPIRLTAMSHPTSLVGAVVWGSGEAGLRRKCLERRRINNFPTSRLIIKSFLADKAAWKGWNHVIVWIVVSHLDHEHLLPV